MDRSHRRPDRQLLPQDGTALLYENFLDESLASALFQQLLSETKWEQGEIVIFGRTVKEPRLSTWHSESAMGYKYSGVVRKSQPWTPLLNDLRDRCSAVTRTPFNSVLVNLYRDGNDGTGWHADNEAVNGPEPTIASVSLGATRRFDLRHRETRETVQVQLKSGSLLVMAGLLQQCWVHQIAKTKRVHDPRINLTFRNIMSAKAIFPNVLKLSRSRVKRMESSKFVMYSTRWCGPCKRLKAMLDADGIEFTEVDLEQDPDAAAIVERVNNGNQTVPTLVFSDGETMTNPSFAKVKEKLSLFEAVSE